MPTTVLLTSLCIAAAPLAAQQPTGRHPTPATRPMAGMHGMAGMSGMGGMQGMGGMMDSMMGPMMQVMNSTPEHLLMQKDKLHLTPQQQQQLATLRDAMKDEHDQAASQAAMHLREMLSAMRAPSADSNAVRTHFDAAFRSMQTAHWAMVRGATQAWPILTATQQSQLAADSNRHGMEHM